MAIGSRARILRTLTSPKRQDEYIAASQLGITLASLGLGMYGEHRLAEIFEHWLAASCRWTSCGGGRERGSRSRILTIGHIVLGEMMPKAIALQHPIAVARFTDWPMRLTSMRALPDRAVVERRSRARRCG